MSVASKMTTWQEFSAIRDEPNLHELIRGEVLTMPPPQSEHGRIVNNINIPLGAHVKKRQLGIVFAAETGFLLETDPDTVRAPDVSFVSRSRLPSGKLTGYFEGAPDFLVEVLSPSDTVFAVEDKIDAWLAAGAKLIWLVNPRNETVTAYRPGRPSELFDKARILDASDIVDGFTLTTSEVFD